MDGSTPASDSKRQAAPALSGAAARSNNSANSYWNTPVAYQTLPLVCMSTP